MSELSDPALFLHGLEESELRLFFQQHNEQPFRARQIFQWVYEKGITSFSEMTDLSKSLRTLLKDKINFSALSVQRQLESKDQETTKFLWKLSDGKLVESVLIRAEDRRTVCVSSQVGCPARCAFCASGKKGLIRHLSSAEIVEQVYNIDQTLKKIGEQVTHVVFMGMGEPLDNYKEVVKAVRMLNDPERMNLSKRRITISTVGLVEEIKRLADEELKVNLVLSLHAPNQHIRKKIIPYARKYPLEEILEAMRYYSVKTKRDITYEYTMIAGINDKIEHAKELVTLLSGQACTVNLIPYNPVDGVHLQRPEKEGIENFRKILMAARIPTTWRYTKGKDIDAACGQLALQEGEKNLEMVQAGGIIT